MYQEHAFHTTPAVPQTGYWLKLGDAAHALGVSEITLRRKVKCGKLAHDFRGGKYYVYLFKDESSGRFYEPDDSDAPPAPRYERTPVLSATRGSALPSISIRESRTPVPAALSVPSRAPSTASMQTLAQPQASVPLPNEFETGGLKDQVKTLEARLMKKDAAMQDLRRALEDQQTLIVFLEDTLKRLGSA